MSRGTLLVNGRYCSPFTSVTGLVSRGRVSDEVSLDLLGQFMVGLRMVTRFICLKQTVVECRVRSI